jgi:hypothetical protein
MTATLRALKAWTIKSENMWSAALSYPAGSADRDYWMERYNRLAVIVSYLHSRLAR